MSDKNRNDEVAGMSDRKREQAMRLFEALGGVDPELLQRSEKKSANKVIPFQRYARSIAACLALAVVGLLGWYTIQNAGGKRAESAEMAPQAARDEAYSFEGSYTAGAKKNAVSDTQGAAAGKMDENCEEAEEECAVAQSNALTTEDGLQTYGDMDSDKLSIRGAFSTGWQGEMLDNYEEAKKTQPYGTYFPEVLPEGYSYECGFAWQDSENPEEILLIFQGSGGVTEYMIGKDEILKQKYSDGIAELLEECRETDVCGVPRFFLPDKEQNPERAGIGVICIDDQTSGVLYGIHSEEEMREWFAELISE